MAKAVRNEYNPGTILPPGDSLQETIEVLGMSEAQLAQLIGQSEPFVIMLIQGKASLTPEVADQLERVLGVPASFWNNGERRYQENLARHKSEKSLSA